MKKVLIGVAIALVLAVGGLLGADFEEGLKNLAAKGPPLAGRGNFPLATS